MELIPAIDIIDGKCVRLTKGDFTKKIVYNDNPLDVAKGFEEAGLKRLHIVDLDGANGQGLKNLKTLENISGNTSLVIDFGGGLKTTEDIKAVFNAGASIVSIGSVAVKNPDLFSKWIIDFGPKNFCREQMCLIKKLKYMAGKKIPGLIFLILLKTLFN